MSAGVFPLLDEDAVTYVAGLWQGYAEALNTLAKAPTRTINDMGDNWQGDRATRFQEWWGPASVDLGTLAGVAQIMADGFKKFAGRVSEINGLSRQASSILTSNAQSRGGGKWVFPGTGSAYKNDELWIMVNGFELPSHVSGPNLPPDPPWFTQMHSVVMQSFNEYTSAANAMLAVITSAPGMLKQMSQLTELTRGQSSFATNSLQSLKDPTWNLLTGGDIFRPKLPPGFDGNPFSTKGVPDWYRPTTFMNIEHWVSAHVDDLVTLATAILAISGQEELAGVLTFIDNSVNTGEALADGDWVEIGSDVLGFVLPKALKLSLAGKVTSEQVDQALEDANFGDDLKKAVAATLTTSSKVPERVADQVGEYVQDQVEDYIKDQIKQAIGQGDPPPANVQIPPGVLHTILANAALQLGAQKSEQAAGVTS